MCTPRRTANTSNHTEQAAAEDAAQPSVHFAGEITKCLSPLENTWHCHTKLYILSDPAKSTPKYGSKRKKQIYTKAGAHTVITTLFIIIPNWKLAKCLPTGKWANSAIRMQWKILKHVGLLISTITCMNLKCTQPRSWTQKDWVIEDSAHHTLKSSGFGGRLQAARASELWLTERSSMNTLGWVDWDEGTGLHLDGGGIYSISMHLFQLRTWEMPAFFLVSVSFGKRCGQVCKLIKQSVHEAIK